MSCCRSRWPIPAITASCRRATSRTLASARSWRFTGCGPPGVSCRVRAEWRSGRRGLQRIPQICEATPAATWSRRGLPLLLGSVDARPRKAYDGFYGGGIFRMRTTTGRGAPEPAAVPSHAQRRTLFQGRLGAGLAVARARAEPARRPWSARQRLRISRSTGAFQSGSRPAGRSSSTTGRSSATSAPLLRS